MKQFDLLFKFEKYFEIKYCEPPNVDLSLDEIDY